MYFYHVNVEFFTNLSKNLNLHVKKHLTYEISQRKFDRVKGALSCRHVGVQHGGSPLISEEIADFQAICRTRYNTLS